MERVTKLRMVNILVPYKGYCLQVLPLLASHYLTKDERGQHGCHLCFAPQIHQYLRNHKEKAKMKTKTRKRNRG
jgi:hypothetical protein